MIVNTCSVPTAFVAVAGPMAMFASTHFFSALSDPPAAVFSAVSVVRETDWPSTRMFEVACTSVVPVMAEVIVTVQLAEVVEAPTTV